MNVKTVVVCKSVSLSVSKLSTFKLPDLSLSAFCLLSFSLLSFNLLSFNLLSFSLPSVEGLSENSRIKISIVVQTVLFTYCIFKMTFCPVM